MVLKVGSELMLRFSRKMTGKKCFVNSLDVTRLRVKKVAVTFRTLSRLVVTVKEVNACQTGK